MRTSRLLFIIAVAFLSVDVGASTSEANTSFTPEKIDLSTASVNSHDGLLNHLATIPKSPFYKLAEPARSHFLGSAEVSNASMSDPRYNTICTVHPDAPSHCDTMNGHHCTEGCG